MLDALAGHADPADEAVLVLISHTCLVDRPSRTRELLDAFLVRKGGAAFQALCLGRSVEVQRGSREAIELLASALEAQGFLLSVRPACVS